jgi:hypothetical protein
MIRNRRTLTATGGADCRHQHFFQDRLGADDDHQQYSLVRVRAVVRHGAELPLADERLRKVRSNAFGNCGCVVRPTAFAFHLGGVVTVSYVAELDERSVALGGKPIGETLRSKFDSAESD